MISELVKVTAKDAEELDKVKAELKKVTKKLVEGTGENSKEINNPFSNAYVIINGSIHDIVFYGMMSKDDHSPDTYFFHYVKHNTWRLFKYRPEMLLCVLDLEMEFETDGVISFLNSRFEEGIITPSNVLYISKGMDLNILGLYNASIQRVVENLYIAETGSLGIPAANVSIENELDKDTSYQPFVLKTAEAMSTISREANLRNVELDNLRKKWMIEIEDSAKKGFYEMESVVKKDYITAQVIREFQDLGYHIRVSPIGKASTPTAVDEVSVVFSWEDGEKKDGTLIICNNCLEDVGIPAPTL
jgi:hypothetical protein